MLLEMRLNILVSNEDLNIVINRIYFILNKKGIYIITRSNLLCTGRRVYKRRSNPRDFYVLIVVGVRP